MNVLAYLIPIALTLGIIGLAGFLWALKSGQYDDPEGAANRILFDDESCHPERSEGSHAAGDPSASPQDDNR